VQTANSDPYCVSQVGIFSSFIFGLLGTLWIAPALAGPDCAGDASRAVQQARQALKTDNPKQDRAALVCLVEAVAALDRKVEALSTGATPNATSGRVLPRVVRTKEGK
jgi:hypothetical protein